MEVVGRPLTHVGGVGAAAAKPAATQASSLQPLASMKLPALKDELRARGHSTGGKKEELVERLTLLRAAAKSQVRAGATGAGVGAADHLPNPSPPLPWRSSDPPAVLAGREDAEAQGRARRQRIARADGGAWRVPGCRSRRQLQHLRARPRSQRLPERQRRSPAGTTPAFTAQISGRALQAKRQVACRRCEPQAALGGSDRGCDAPADGGNWSPVF